MGRIAKKAKNVAGGLKRKPVWIAILAALACSAAALGVPAPSSAGETAGRASVAAFGGNVSLVGAGSGDAVVSGATLLNAFQASIDGGLSFSRLLGERARSVMGAMKTAEEKYGPGTARAALDINNDRLNRFWVRGIQLGVNHTGKGNPLGYEYTPGGAALGYDQVAGDFFAGWGLSYTNGVLHNQDVNDDNRIDTYRVGMYGGYRNASGFFSKFLAGLSHGKNNMSEYIEAAEGWRSADYKNNSWMVGNICGVEIPAGAFTLTPTIGLIQQDAFSRAYTTAGVTRQRFDRLRASSLAMPVDLSVSYTAKFGPASSLTLSVNGGYVHEFRPEAPTGTMEFVGGGSAPTAVRGMTPDRDALVFGTGLTYRFRRFEVGAAYNYDGKKPTDNHLLNGSFGVSF